MAPVYRPNNQQDLVDQMRAIVEAERSCVFAISGDFDRDALSSVVISLDGVTLSENGSDGWRFRDDMHVELVGAACDALMSGDHEVEGSLYCGALEELPPVK